MTASVFIGTSVDGFIARPNDELDFLPEGGGEPHGYNEFIASVDAIVIGRKTFEKVLTFGAWPYGDKRVVVLSSRPLDLSKAIGGVVEQMAGSHLTRLPHSSVLLRLFPIVTFPPHLLCNSPPLNDLARRSNEYLTSKRFLLTTAPVCSMIARVVSEKPLLPLPPLHP